jgi:hypothetical protein
MQLTKIIAAVKAAPNYRIKVGELEVIGIRGAWDGRTRWTFDYIIRTVRENGSTRVAYGRRNAEEYVVKLANDTAINTDIKTFYPAPVEPEFKGHDAEGMATFKLPFSL